MSDHQHRVLAFKAINRLLHQPFAFTVQRAGSLIEDQQLWVPQDGAGQGKSLALAAAEAIAPFAHEGIEAFRQSLDEAGSLGLFGRLFNGLTCGVRRPERDVVGDARIEQEGVLAHHAELLLPAPQINSGHRGAVHQNLTLRGVVKPRKKIGDRAFAGSAAAHQGNGLSLRQGEIDFCEGWV